MAVRQTMLLLLLPLLVATFALMASAQNDTSIAESLPTAGSSNATGASSSGGSSSSTAINGTNGGGQCPASASSPGPLGAFPRSQLCCFVPSNTSAAFTKFYNDFCPSVVNTSSGGVPPDLATNVTAAALIREAYTGFFNASAAAVYLQDFQNDTIAGVPVIWASPKTGTPLQGSASSNTTTSSSPNSTTSTSGNQSSKLLIYLHGGGYVIGSCYAQLYAVGIVAVEAGTRVICPEYRLAPEHPFPAGLNDSAAVYEALIGSNADLNYDYSPENVALVGDSAGGGLVMALLLLLQQRGLPLPGAAGVYSPWVELSGPTDTYKTLGDFDIVTTLSSSGFPDPMAVAYVSGVNRLSPQQVQALLVNPLVSPVHGDFNSSSAIRLPPVLIQVGLRESLLGDSVLLFRRLLAGGQCAFLSPWVGMPHVFQYIALGTPEADAAQREMGRFFARHLGTNTTSSSADSAAGGGGGGDEASGGSGGGNNNATRVSASGTARCCW